MRYYKTFLLFPPSFSFLFKNRELCLGHFSLCWYCTTTICVKWKVSQRFLFFSLKFLKRLFLCFSPLFELNFCFLLDLAHVYFPSYRCLSDRNASNSKILTVLCSPPLNILDRGLVRRARWLAVCRCTAPRNFRWYQSAAAVAEPFETLGASDVNG